jgi:hypothetical protein
MLLDFSEAGIHDFATTKIIMLPKHVVPDIFNRRPVRIRVINNRSPIPPVVRGD